MRRHTSASAFVAVVLLLGLTGYLADSAKSTPETSVPSLIAQAEEGKAQPDSGEVQERAVPRTMPGKGMIPAPGIAPKPMVPAAPPISLPCTGGGGVMPGEYALGTWRGTYLTAVNGGGLITEPVVRTDVQRAGPWEKYKLFVLPSSDPTGQWFIQTATKNCVTAVDGGGRTSQVLHTDATKAQAWEFFRFYFDPALGWHGIQTVNLHYVTALGGGGHADPPAVHTDAVKVDNWEKFRVWKCGDLGTNLHYSIWVPYNGTLLQAEGEVVAHSMLSMPMKRHKVIGASSRSSNKLTLRMPFRLLMGITSRQLEEVGSLPVRPLTIISKQIGHRSSIGKNLGSSIKEIVPTRSRL